MNNGRIWCVVNPTVGLPLFLGGVAGIALIVHASVLSNTTWMSGYWAGSAGRAAPRADAEPAPANANLAQAGTDQGTSVSVTPVVAGPGQPTTFVITITPRAGETPQPVTLVQRADAPPDGSAAPATAVR
jgi:light-harvesting protein B-800-850 alpha chain